MTSVAHSAGTCLRSTLIGSSLKDFIVALIVKSRCQCSELYLKANLAIATLTNLLFTKVSLIRRRHLWPHRRSGILRMFLGGPGERIEAQCHLWEVARLKEIGSLEDFLVGNAVLFDSL